MSMRRIELPHSNPGLSGWVDWDDETGELSGPLAETLSRLAAQAASEGMISAPPHPCTYEIGPAPLKSRRDFALLVASAWRVPPELADDLPPPPEDDEEEESDVVVLR